MAASKKKPKTPKKSAKLTTKVTPPPNNGGDTEEESIHDVKMSEDESVDDIPDIVDKESGDEDDSVAEEENQDSGKGKNKKGKDASKPEKKDKKTIKSSSHENKQESIMPFMDTFYQLSSEESSRDRSIAARDLIRHCFFSDSDAPSAEGINQKDAAYALTRLMNGLCTGRAASRQGFASCLSTFLRVVYSPSFNADGNGSAMKEILKEDAYANQLKGKTEEVDDSDATHPAMIVRQKLLSTTQFLQQYEKGVVNASKNKNKFGGKMKGMEERDHAFGRLFGILSVVRSGILGMEDFPSAVVEGYVQDLIDLHHYKNWMREPAAHAIIELLSSLGAESNLALITKVANGIIIPNLFLSRATDGEAPIKVDTTNRPKWIQELTPEQIAVALHLQMPQHCSIKYSSPLDQPLLTAESVPVLATALASTSSIVHPRCHVVWNAVWMYLTEEVPKTIAENATPKKKKGKSPPTASGEVHRQLRATDDSNEFTSIVEKIIQHVVVDLLLGKGEESSSPTHERRALTLQIICTLTGSNEMKVVIPSNLIGSVLCPEVVEGIFLNVLCASGGLGKKKAKAAGSNNEGTSVEHYLKPLTSAALIDLVDFCSEYDFVERRMAFAKSFLSAEPRFDVRTKTQTVSSILMLDNNGKSSSEESESRKNALWESYHSFLEEQIVSAKSLHAATVYIELMYKLAKRDLNVAPADQARRVVRFFMSGAFFDCSTLVDPTSEKKSTSSKKKKGKKSISTDKQDQISAPQELSSGLRIKELLNASGQESIPQPVRAIVSARYFSLLSDFISVINAQHRGGNKNQFYGNGGRPEAVYRALSEICGIASLLETSGARKFLPKSESSVENDSEDPMVSSRNFMLQVQSIADEALVRECDESGDSDMLRAEASFATGCASLMMSLYLQLNSCGTSEETDDNDEDNSEDDAEAVHEYISDLAESVTDFREAIKDLSKIKVGDDQENPMAAMAGLLVNILSSPIGGEDAGSKSPIQASASKLTRETVKMAWSGIISIISGLSVKNSAVKNFTDEDVMNILIESVCGPNAMNTDGDNEDGESVEGSDASEDDSDGSGVFVEASKIDMDLDQVEKSDSEQSDESEEEDPVDEDVELDSSQLENMLLEDSDAEMSESGFQLEHHAGADAALAQLIKMKQEARKASQSDRERIEFCNRLRCAVLLDSLFSAGVFKSGWLPIEAVLGSLVPILSSRKLIGKNIQSSSSASHAKKSLSEKTALLDRLTALVKDRISKYRCSDESSSHEVSLKASADIFEEMKHSLNAADCSCCSIALITAVRSIPNVEDCDEIKTIYTDAVQDWSSRKATKIHACAFDDLIQRMPSLSAVILVEPLLKSAKDAHSAFLKCESMRLLSLIYRHGTAKSHNDNENAENLLSKKALGVMKNNSSKIAVLLNEALCDQGMKAKHRDEVLNSTKHLIHYAKSQDTGIMSLSELNSLKETLSSIKSESKGVKQLCSQMSETISEMTKLMEEATPAMKVEKTPKKSSKKKKVTKK